MAEEKFVYTACMGNGCHEHCFLKTIVRDGKIVRTEKADLGAPEGLRYGTCQKGIEYARFPYLQSRLLHPLKRVGKRGEGKFEEISWDQAMDEIGAKLCEIRDKYGSEAVVVNTFACGYPANWTSLHMGLLSRFIHTFGASCQTMESVDRGYWFATQFDLGSWRYSQYDPRLLVGAKYVFIWGSNPIGATRAVGTTRYLLDAQELGAKLVTIGLVYDSTAAKSDKFVPIKGGTDTAMALAMNRLLIEEDLWDHDYVKNYTVAPFLVREDNGRFLRESDILNGGDPEKYVFWNSVPAEARSISAHKHDFGNSIPDLLAAPIVRGIKCQTAFLKLKKHLAQWTLESQEAITGVPAETVRQLVHEYVTNKPAAIWLNLGLRYYNAREAHRAIQLLSALSGNLGLKHGKLAMISWNDGWPVRLNDSPVLYPDGPAKVKGIRPSITDFLESFRKPGKPSKYKALLNVVGNPVHAAPGRKMWTEQIFPQLELIVDYEVKVTDTALFADYVLPDTTTFERMELLVPVGNWAVLQEPAIEPMGDVKPPADFWRELAKRVGLEQYFNKTTEEWLELRLQSKDPAIASLNPPLTLERLKKEKMVRLNVPAEPFDCFEQLGFLTPSGRFEIYCVDLADVDEAMAKWIPPLIHSSKRQDYPLHLMVARHRLFMQTQFTDLPDLRAIAGNEPWMRINPRDAAARGIDDGNLVEVLNDRGKLKVKARFSQVVPPGVVQMWFGYRAGEYVEGAPTLLQVPLGTAETDDACSRKWIEIVEKRWAPLPGVESTWESFAAGRIPKTVSFETQFAGNWDVIWDNFCEVRKASEGK